MGHSYNHERVAAIIAAQAHLPGALLPVLHEIHDAFGHIPPGSIAQIASALNLSRAEVHGVVTYYRHFRTEPPARHTIQVCCAESCQSMGAERLATHAREKLSESRAGEVELEPVYCLGLCGVSPAIMVDGTPHARVTPEKFDRLLNDIGGKP